MKKLLKYLLTGIGILILAIIILVSLGASLIQIGTAILNIITIAGGGSVIRGIFIVPFFIFGVVQIFRGFTLLMEKLEHSDHRFIITFKKSYKSYDLTWLYFPITLVSYISVFFAIFFLGKG